MTQHNPSDLPRAETPLTTPGALPPEELPAYTGESAVCAKCGKRDAITRYRAAGEHGARDLQTFRPSHKSERLERECWRCDYTWDEALTDGTDPDENATGEEPADDTGKELTMMRIRLDDMTDADLDAIYDRLERAEASVHAAAADAHPDTSGETADTRGRIVRTPVTAESDPDAAPLLNSTDTIRTTPDTDTADSVRTVQLRTVRRDEVAAAIAQAFELPAQLVTARRVPPPCL